VPSAFIFAVNTSWLQLLLVRVVFPKTAVSKKVPVTMDEPSGRAEIVVPMSVSVPPPLVAQAQEPSAFIFAVNTSRLPPLLVRTVLPKVAVPLKVPVTMDEPSGSVETPPALTDAPSAVAAHAQVPSTFAFAVNIPLPLALVRVVLPKVAVPSKYPVTIEEPSGRAEIALPWSLPVSPALMAQFTPGGGDALTTWAPTNNAKALHTQPITVRGFTGQRPSLESSDLAHP
jgi:hypothetical protein